MKKKNPFFKKKIKPVFFSVVIYDHVKDDIHSYLNEYKNLETLTKAKELAEYVDVFLVSDYNRYSVQILKYDIQNVSISYVEFDSYS
jgi:hypothetical protein